MKRIATRLEAAVLKLASAVRRPQVRAIGIGAGVLLAATATSVGAYHSVPPATHVRPVADSSAATPTASAEPAVSGPQAGGKNIVQVINVVDQNLRIRGRAQLNAIPAPGVAPVNLASAYSSCTNCGTLAVALQINLISTSTHYAAPANAATAVNYLCSGCETAAVAYQYTISVDDPTQVPSRVRQLVSDVNAQLRDIEQTATTVAEGLRRVQAVVQEYQDLAVYLTTKMSRATDATTPGASATPPSPDAVTPSPASPSATPTSTPAATEPTPTPTPSDSPSPGPSP